MKNLCWSLAVGWRGQVLRNAPDAGGPGGPTDAGVAGDAGHSAGAHLDGDPPRPGDEPGPAPDAHADADTDDDADDDDGTFDPAYHESLKRTDPKAAKRYRNAINRSKAAAPLLQTLRTLGIDPKDSQAVAAFVRNGITPKPAIAPAAPAATAKPEDARPKWTPLPTDEKFDPAAFAGWDPSDAGNKALLGHMERAHKTGQQANALANAYMVLVEDHQALKARIDAMENGGKAKEREAGTQAWRTEVQTAVKAIPDPEVREAFLDSVAGAARREQAAGRKPDPKAIVATVLKRFQKNGQVTPREAARVTAAAQGIADRNRTAPSRAALAPGGPAGSPTHDRSNERIRDVSRRLVGSSYVGMR